MSTSQANPNFDLSSLDLYSETIPVNPDANMDDRPPMPPEKEDGYKAIPTLKYNEDSSAFRVSKQYNLNGRTVTPLMVTVEFKLEDEGQPWDGNLYSAYPSTRVLRSGTTEIDQLLKAFYTPEAYAAHRMHMYPEGQKVKTVIERLIEQRPVRVVLEWQAEKEDPTKPKRLGRDGNEHAQNKVILYGMRKFPSITDANGNLVYQPMEIDPQDNQPVYTKIKIVNYLTFKG